MGHSWRLCTRQSGEWDIVHSSGERTFVSAAEALEDIERWIVDVAFSRRGCIGRLAAEIRRDGQVVRFRPLDGLWRDDVAALDRLIGLGQMFW